MSEIFIMGILGAAIANYKFKNETYLKNFLKGIIVGAVGFLIKFIPNYFNHTSMDMHRNIDALLFSLGIGVVVGLFFMLLYGLRKSQNI